MKLKVFFFAFWLFLGEGGAALAEDTAAGPRYIMNDRIIYTLGTGFRSEAGFINTVKTYFVKAVIDLRSRPYSRYSQFNRDRMKKYLEKNGILYIYMGDILGGLVEEGFDAYRAGEVYQKSLTPLEETALSQLSVIICSEYSPFSCHRLKIAEDLEKRGWKALHILNEKTCGTAYDIGKLLGSGKEGAEEK